ncbi:MAG: helix-turn-helix domain-containing protein [Chitinophagaceae bacterium]|nr:helix-turn-helix domain-containing protein [Chitinophagaceae bacterium]
MNNPFEVIEARLSNIETLLLDLKHKTKEQGEQPPAEELLTVQDTAKLLSLSVPTIYGLISKGELPVMKRSKRCYFSKVELINYLKQGRKKTLAETAIEAENYLSGKKRKSEFDAAAESIVNHKKERA